MSSDNISPLIRDAINKHCQDNQVKNAITGVLYEMIKIPYYKRYDNKLFKKRYKDIILANFKEDIEDG